MLTRRTFVASTLALGVSASWARAAAHESRQWDLIVVGAGTAGLPAAIFAARRGARVLLVDAAEDIGGTLHLANGQVSAAGTRLQRELGIEDSPDLHFDDVMRLSRKRADPNVVRLTADHAGETIDWLMAGGLVPLEGHPITGASPGRLSYSARRYLWGANEGRDLLAVLRRELAPAVASDRVQLQLDTRVDGLITAPDGAVTGVRASVAGRVFSFHGRKVLLSSGGYAMNPQLFELLVGHPAYAAGSYPHSQGDGLKLAVSVGGWLRGQDLHRAGSGSILTDDRFGARVYARFDTIPQRRLPWEIWVNRDGERFLREDEPDDYVRTSAVVQQPELRYAIVFDQRIVEQAPVGITGWSRETLLEHFGSHPMFVRAESLAELAALAGIDPEGLTATVEHYNANVRNGAHDPLGREHRPLPISRPPFYAITQLGSSATSSAGVVVDATLRVLRGDGAPVGNLYAAGEVLGSGATMGAGFAPGMMLTPALTLGRLLGERLIEL
ncbi:MAG: FAD-dependent oxidoreductase [Gammaproteobacteria bacterium]|nr:FAD-dependent oxidoreductase [Gammaproteobacteria bacterium]